MGSLPSTMHILSRGIQQQVYAVYFIKMPPARFQYCWLSWEKGSSSVYEEFMNHNHFERSMYQKG